MVLNSIASALPIPGSVRQELLAEDRIMARADRLLELFAERVRA
jgi:hypothetical protein